MEKMLFALKASVVEAHKYNTQEKALEYIVNQAMFKPINMSAEEGALAKRNFTEGVLNKDLSHCNTMKQKLYFMGLMTNKLLQTKFEWRKTDDRDSYINKRIDLTGTLLNNLFRNYFNKLVKDMQSKRFVKSIMVHGNLPTIIKISLTKQIFIKLLSLLLLKMILNAHCNRRFWC